MQINRGYGFTDEYPVSRFYCGSRYGTPAGGTSGTLRGLVGQRILSEFEGGATSSGSRIAKALTQTVRGFPQSERMHGRKQTSPSYGILTSCHFRWSFHVHPIART
jgi:hypothetical protein